MASLEKLDLPRNHPWDPGLSPTQERVAEEIARRARKAAVGGLGRVLFLTGEMGSGRSHLLRVVAERLERDGDDFRVATGGLASDQPARKAPDWTEKMGPLFTGATAVAAALNPALSLAKAAAELSVAAADALRTAAQDPEDAELVSRVLRAAAREAPGQALVCLVDDASWLSGTWWTELQFSFAKEIARELPLLLVLAIDDPPTSAGLSGERELPPHRVRKSLSGRDLADSTSLGNLTSYELRDWLGSAPRAIIQGALDLTRGRSGEVVELWWAWLADDVLTEADGEGWELKVAEEILTGDALAKLAEMIERAIPRAKLTDEETIRETLAFGALEGRVFTAAAVADAIGRDRDVVEDLLDELVEAPRESVLRPPRPLEVHDLRRGKSWTLWRYEFASRLLWRAVLGRLSDFSAKEAAQRLLDALANVYEHDVPAISPVMARLADLCDQPALADYYRSLVTAPSEAALAAQAHRLMTADSGDWTSLDHRDAARILADAALQLSSTADPRTLLPLTERAADHAKQATRGGYRAMGFVLAVRGSLFLRSGELDLAEESLEQAREILAEGDPGLLANVLRLLAEVIGDRRQEEERQKGLLEASLLLYRRAKDRKGEATVQYNLASIAIEEEDFAKARGLNERALATMRSSHDREQEMTILQQRANIEQRTGNFDLARGLAEETLRYNAATGRTRGEATSLHLLARIEWRAGNLEEARAAGEAALALHRRFENQVGEAGALHALGDVIVALGEAERGRELLQRARESLERIGDERQLSRVEDKLKELPGPA